MDSLELVSPLSPDECVARLTAAIDNTGIMFSKGYVDSKPLVGNVTTRRVLLGKRIWYRNSFQTFLIGELRATTGGTVFRGTFAVHPVVRVLMTVWVTVVCVVSGVFVVAGVRGWLAGGEFFPGAIIAPLMLPFGWVMVKGGRLLARDEDEFLAEFVAATLCARDRAADASPAAVGSEG